jgi:carbon monoxide dehydrogenase subunit G
MEARFLSVKIKLGVPNYPGDTMTFSGEVSDKRVEDRTVEITLKGRNSMGNHVTGTVRVQLP